MYDLSQQARQKLATGLVAYYDEAWHAGVMSRLDIMARSGMGTVPGYLDVASDTYASLKKKSNDDFMIKFKSELEGSARRYFSNMPDVMTDALPLAKAALDQLASMIPVPLVGAALSKLVGFAGNAAAEELRAQAVTRADEQVTTASGGPVRKIFTNEVAAQQAIDKALEQYKTVGRFIGTIPSTINSFQDAITFPSSVFKVQKAASSLNIALVEIRDYIESMQSRLEEVQKVYGDYKTRLGTQMPAAVDAVIDSAYEAGYQKGLQRFQQGRPGNPIPEFREPTVPGAATQLAAYVAHAMAQGMYDAFPVTRGRSGGSHAPPPPSGMSMGRIPPRRP